MCAFGYAVWAFTARRGIFADFSQGVTVSQEDANSNDTVDTLLLVVAGLVVIVALVWWVVRITRSGVGGPVGLSGVVLSALGLVTVAVGLFLSSAVADAGSQAEQGDKGVIATVVVGSGFVLVGLGVVLGAAAVRAFSSPQRESNQTDSTQEDSTQLGWTQEDSTRGDPTQTASSRPQW